MKIFLLRTWLTNIGNGFIDSGAHALLKKAFPSAKIIELSGYPYHLEDVNTAHSLKETIGVSTKDRMSSGYKKRSSMTNLSEFFDADFAILPGCVLYEHALRKYMPLLKRLNKRGILIILLGAGGGDYGAKTQSYVKSTINELNITALLSRDSVAYDCYSTEVDYSYNGIDCAFFINDWHSPPESRSPFEVRTFDKILNLTLIPT